MTHKYTHLHIHTHGSFLDSTVLPDALAKRAKELGMSALALTDHGNLFNAITFYVNCKDNGIKPILGMEINFVPSCEEAKNTKSRRVKHLILLAENQIGWNNLVKLASLSNAEENFYYQPRIDFKMLEEHKDGLIALSACAGGVVASHLREKRDPDGGVLDYKNPFQADAAVRLFKGIFGSNHFFLEVQDSDAEEQLEINSELRKLALKHGLKTVVTSNVHYLNKEDVEGHRALNKIGGEHWGLSLTEMETSSQYLKIAEELSPSILQDEIATTNEIANRCNVTIDLNSQRLPTYPHTPAGKTAMSYLMALTHAGFQERGLPDTKEYRDRVARELCDIEKLGFADYFLIVADVLNWAKKQNMLIGPGRGSAAGSLVSYCLGITDIDPIKYGLIWERFLNIGRKSLPDIDSDIPRSKRGLVIDYIRQRFGSDNVAQLATFNKLAARACLKDIFKVFGMEFAEANKITQLLPTKDEEHVAITIDKAIEMVPELKTYEDQYKAWFNIARAVEGRYKSLGTHAAAVVIADKPFAAGHYPLVRSADSKNLVFSWEMGVVDKLSLLKLDILGLSTLDVIQDTFDLIKARHGKSLSFANIPLDNQKAFDLLADGKNVGVFQLESQLGRSWSKQLKPSSIEEIADMTAIIRPAVLDNGFGEQYAEVKSGQRIPQYIHPDLKQILDKTNGIMLYQEEMIEICKQIGGMSLVEADSYRKAVGKKHIEQLKAKSQEFIAKCIGNGYSKEVAEEIWSWLDKAGGYSFNKCLSGDTIVKRSGSGAFGGGNITISEMWDYFHGAKKRTPRGKKYRNKIHPKKGVRILTQKDGRAVPARIADVVKNGIKETWLLTLENGMSLRATKDHRILTENGWKTLGSLVVKDKILVSDLEYEKTNREYMKQICRFSRGERIFKKNVQYYGVGEKNCGYIDGGSVAFKAIRKNKIDTIGACEECCDDESRLELAHLDGDHTNQVSTNLKLLCASCHKTHDYRANDRIARFEKGYPTYYSQVVSIDQPKFEETYDIEIAADQHNFFGNGICTHNSHAISYGLLAYYTAYLKSNYTIEFFCAALKNAKHAQDSSDEIKKFVYDASLFGIKIVPPKFSKGNVDFDIIDEQHIAFGLSSLKGVGEKAIASLTKSHSMSNFNEVLKLNANKRVVQALIYSGALDEFGESRNQMAAKHALYSELTANELKIVNSNSSRGFINVIRDLADESKSANYKTKDQKIPNSARRETLRELLKALDAADLFDGTVEKIGWEQHYLGISLTGKLSDLVRAQNVCSDVVNYGGQEMPVELAVQVSSVKPWATKKGPMMAFMTAGDETYELDNFVIFPALYDRYKGILEAGSILKVRGKVDDRGSVIVDRLERVR